MIKVNSLIKILEKNHSNFFTGVPDSVLKQLSIYLQRKNKKQQKGLNRNIIDKYYTKSNIVDICYNNIKK